MDEYMRRLKQQLLLEGSCAMSRCGRGGGVYEYVQREFAYNEGRLDGGELSKRNIISMFESGLICANEGETMFRAEDIINTDRHCSMRLQSVYIVCLAEIYRRYRGGLERDRTYQAI